MSIFRSRKDFFGGGSSSAPGRLGNHGSSQGTTEAVPISPWLYGGAKPFSVIHSKAMSDGSLNPAVTGNEVPQTPVADKPNQAEG